MIESKILVPVDFTPAADRAIEFGMYLAKNMHANLTLLHVLDKDSNPRNDCENKLSALAGKIAADPEIFCDYILEKGNIFNVIPEIASRSSYRMMVIATHGAKGFRQKVFGPDILKLLKKIPVPTLVVQENSRVPGNGFSTAVLPVGGHDAFRKNVEGMITVAGMFDPEIHLYSINKVGFEQTDKLKENIHLTEKLFADKGINYKRVAEEQNVFSIGFAKQTLNYASQVNADIIAIMANPTRDYAYFADSDKEAVLVNDQYIPILCSSDAEADI